MRNDYEINALRGQLQNYLRSKGIDISRAFRCLCPDHEDVHPSMHYDGRRNKVHCFSCGFDGDIFDLVGKEHGVEGFDKQFELVRDILQKLERTGQKNKISWQMVEILKHANQYVQNDEAVLELIRRAKAGIDKTDYFKKRGLSDALIKKRFLGYIPSSPGESERVVIPISQSSAQERLIGSDVKSTERYRVRGNDHYYGLESLVQKGEDRPVFVTESAMDALSVEEAGGIALGLCGATKWQMLHDMLSEGKITPRYPLLIALDNDNAGKKATRDFTTKLTNSNIPYRVVDIVGEHKDPNDALVANRKVFIEKVREAELSVMPDDYRETQTIQENNVGNYALSFLEEDIRPVMQEAIRTGFPTFDAALGGGLYEGLICIGAITSLGKTTFVLQITDFATKLGYDVLFISMEMSRHELMAKSISKEALIRVLEQGHTSEEAFTMRDVLSFQKSSSPSGRVQLFTDAVTAYHRNAKDHMYIYEGTSSLSMDKIRELVDTHISQRGKAPIVVVDYLQILTPFTANATDKQSIDQALIELKRISRDFHIPVIAISSFNRNNYSGHVRMEAFKESGAIEYSADVLLGMQMVGAGLDGFDVLKAKRANPREVEIFVLKNRNGEAGTSVVFDYYAAYNLFWEKNNPLPGSDSLE